MSSSTQTLTQRRAAGAASSSSGASASSHLGVVRVPSTKPPFSVGDIRRAIPAHCFTRPLSKSFGYLLGDLAVVGALAYAASAGIPLVSDVLVGAQAGPFVRAALWVAYWIVCGCVGTGLWVIGHECGHGGFADNVIINHGVGLILHSALLVPYFAWAISHRRHHSNTGSVEHDEVHVPPLASEEKVTAKQSGHHEEMDGGIRTLFSAIQRMVMIVVMLTMGWPAYIIANVSGNKSYDPRRWVNHFTPNSPIFTTGSDSDAQNQRLIVLSDVALAAAFYGLYRWACATSFMHVMCMYGVPYLVVNLWLVLITYLQHTDLALPHYTDGEWDWLRGALATVDRDYGMLNVIFHHITDTHVVHHLFSSMPHYHAEEATAAVRQLLGSYYRYHSTPVFSALWNSFRDCTELYPDPKQKGVHWFD